MFDAEINYVSVLVAGGASMVIGFIYYHPKVFGDVWMKLVGQSKGDIDAKKGEMNKIYGLMLVASLVMAWVLALFVRYAGAETLFSGAMMGFFAWLGFVATSMLTGVLFEGRPIKLFYLNSTFQLVTLVVMGIILAVWQ